MRTQILLILAFILMATLSFAAESTCSTPQRCLDEARFAVANERTPILARAFALWPDDPSIMWSYGESLFLNEEFAAAIEALPSCDQQPTTLQEACATWKGASFLQLGRAEEGLEVLRDSATAARDEGTYSIALAWYLHGLIDAAKVRDARDWIEVVRRYHLSPSQEAQLYLEVARADLLDGSADRALQALDLAISKNDMDSTRLAKALTLCSLGNDEAAAQLISTVEGGQLLKSQRRVPDLLRMTMSGEARAALELAQVQVSEYPYEQSGWLIGARAALLVGGHEASCRWLERGKVEARSRVLLNPIWGRRCHEDS